MKWWLRFIGAMVAAFVCTLLLDWIFGRTDWHWPYAVACIALGVACGCKREDRVVAGESEAAA